MKQLLAISLCLTCYVLSMPVFQPQVKEYLPQTGTFKLKPQTRIFHEPIRSCEIAAQEIPGRHRIQPTLSNITADGIYIFTRQSPTGQKLISKKQLHIPNRKQGYAIHVDDRQIVIIGHDPQGALYGAVTLRQMVENGNIQAATLRDWPDILYRGTMSFGRGLKRLAIGDKDSTEGIKAGLDEMLRHKLNIISDYFGYSAKSSKDTLRQLAELNHYAIERGIYPNLYPSTALWTRHNHPANISPKNWPCIIHQSSWQDHYYCWSDDQATESAALRYAQIMKKMGVYKGIIIIHPVDGGAVPDPEDWSRRCPQCKKRWKDDERWKASINQFTIWNRVLSRQFPETIIGSCVYPYTIGLLQTPPTKRNQVFKRNVTQYWQRLSDGLADKSFFFSSWICAPELLAPYRQLIGKRRLHFSDTYPITAGIFSTYHRFAGSIFEPTSENIFSTQATDAYGQWESLCLVAEHTWNLNAPGSERFDGGTYYDGLKDHGQPTIIMTDTLPRICHTFWGRELAPHMTKIMSSGITPRYIEHPAKTVAYWNRIRKDPLFDPNVKKDTLVIGNKKPIIDDAELMRKQVEAASLVVRELKLAQEHLQKLNRFKRKYFMFFAKRAPFWLAAARAQYEIRRCNNLILKGQNNLALEYARKARVRLHEDYQAAEENLKALATEPDTNWRLEWSLDRKNMAKMMTNAERSARVILQPRRIGRFIRIGVTNGESAKGTVDYLKRFDNVKTQVIDNLTLAELDGFDCIIVTAKSYDKENFFKNLKAYVQKGGGGVFLEGPLCGHARFDTRTPFPDIVKTAPAQRELFTRTLKLADGTQVKTMYVDCFELIPGQAGEVLVQSLDDKPIVVRGTSGLGKVVFSGIFNLEGLNNTYSVGYTTLFGVNADIVRNAIEYFTGIKLRGKK